MKIEVTCSESRQTMDSAGNVVAEYVFQCLGNEDCYQINFRMWARKSTYEVGKTYFLVLE